MKGQWMGGWNTRGRMDRRIDERTEGWVGGTDGWTDERREGQTNRLVVGEKKI